MLRLVRGMVLGSKVVTSLWKGHPGYPKLFLPHDVFHMTDKHFNVFWSSSNVLWHWSEVTCRPSGSEPAWSPFLLEKIAELCLLADGVGRKRNYHTSPTDFSFMSFDWRWALIQCLLVSFWVLTVTWDFVFATSASKLHALTSLEDIYRKYRTIMFQSWSDPPLICAASRVR